MFKIGNKAGKIVEVTGEDNEGEAGDGVGGGSGSGFGGDKNNESDGYGYGGADDMWVEVVVVMAETRPKEVGLVKMEMEMGLFENLVVSALGFSDISVWFLVSRIRTFLLE